MIICGFILKPNFLVYAEASDNPGIRIYDSDTLKLEGEFLPFIQNQPADFSLSVADLGGDGIDEILVGAGYGTKPLVKIFRANGSLINEFFAYDQNFTGGIEIFGADLDNDKKNEIITAAGRTGGPHIRIFDAYGQPKGNNGWMAFDDDYTAGIKIAIGDINKDNKNEIIVSRVYDLPKAQIKIFDSAGEDLKKDFYLDKFNGSLNLNITTADLGGDGQAELLINGGYNLSPEVYLYRQDGSLIGSSNVFDQNFHGGVNLASADLNNDGRDEIVAGAGFTGGAHVKILDGYGKLIKEFFAYDSDFNGGVKIAVGQLDKDPALEIITAPAKIAQEKESGKYIKVDAGKTQTLYAYDDGFLIRDFKISSGLSGSPTPLGQFSVYRKRPLVNMGMYYGPNNTANYNLPNVPWVASFKGPYTIHGTYWHHNFGHPMSHGCVNMYTPDAKWIYDWVDIGTPVTTYK